MEAVERKIWTKYGVSGLAVLRNLPKQCNANMYTDKIFEESFCKLFVGSSIILLFPGLQVYLFTDYEGEGTHSFVEGYL